MNSNIVVFFCLCAILHLFRPSIADPTILIIGGYGSSKSLEYFFPWNLSSNRLAEQELLTPRGGAVAGVLNDSRVLVAGGWNEQSELFLRSSEFFDPEADTSETGPNLSARRSHAAAAVVQEAIIVCGGRTSQSDDTRSCERLHNGSWESIEPMREAREEFAMVAIGKEVLAIGGRGLRAQLSSIERYDVSSGRWSRGSPMPTRRMGHGAAVLDGYLYVCGGFHDNAIINICEQFDLEKMRWIRVANMKQKRYRFSLVAMHGKLFALGGMGLTSRSVEVYSPWENEWHLLAEELRRPRWGAPALPLEITFPSTSGAGFFKVQGIVVLALSCLFFS